METKNTKSKVVRVVLVGGGHANVEVIRSFAFYQNNYYRKKQRNLQLPMVKLILVSEYETSFYSGMIPGCIAGQYAPEELQIPLRALCEWSGTKFICDRMEKVEWNVNEIHCLSGNIIKFDILALNIGSLTFLPPSLLEHHHHHHQSSDLLVSSVNDDHHRHIILENEHKNNNDNNFDDDDDDGDREMNEMKGNGGAKKGNGWEKIIFTRPLATMLNQLNAFYTSLNYNHPPIIDGDHDNNNNLNTVNQRYVKVVIVGGGAAGVELAFAMRTKLLTLKYTPNITIINSGAVLSSFGQSTSNRVTMKLKEKRIELIDDYVVDVKVEESILVLSKDRKLSYDVTLFATGALPPTCVSSLQLPLDQKGFIKVKNTLQTEGNENVFAVGDVACFVEFPLAKAGVYSVREGAILAQNILNMILRKPLIPYIPQKSFLILINTCDGEAISSWHGLSYCSTYLYSLKNYIDTKFIKKYTPKFMGASPL